MPGPDMRAYMEGLIGRELFTPVDRHSNWIVRLTNGSVIVRTAGNQEGGAVSIDFVQGVVNRIYDGEEVVFDPRRRSAFLGALLATMDEVEVLTDPRRARLVPGAARRTRTGRSTSSSSRSICTCGGRPKQPPAGHADLHALSNLLHRLPIHPEHTRAEDFRNINGVRRKLGDFTAPDPDYTGAPTRGGEGVHLVWERFVRDPDGLAEAGHRFQVLRSTSPLGHAYDGFSVRPRA